MWQSPSVKIHTTARSVVQRSALEILFIIMAMSIQGDKNNWLSCDNKNEAWLQKLLLCLSKNNHLDQIWTINNIFTSVHCVHYHPQRNVNFLKSITRCAVITNPVPGSTNKYDCKGMEGRYINILIPGTPRILTLCEVEVKGQPTKTIPKLGNLELDLMFWKLDTILN